MITRQGKMFIMLLTVSTLTACSSTGPLTTHRAYCNTLKSNMIFSRQTSITRNANIQASEAPLQASNYDEECEVSPPQTAT